MFPHAALIGYLCGRYYPQAFEQLGALYMCALKTEY